MSNNTDTVNENTQQERDANTKETNNAEEDREGLYGKYEVTENGDPVPDCFVLEPGTDKAARMAIRTYAEYTPDGELSEDLIEWMDELEGEDE